MKNKSIMEKIFKFFASLQLALIVMSSLGILSAVGTIVEAKYDTNYAQKIIYHSPYMYLTLGLLCINLFMVMVDRWPWKRHHAGFVFAHIGIIILIAGSVVTRFYGIDGSISIDIGQSNRYVSLTDPELAVYATFGDGNYKQLFQTRQNFLTHHPKKYPVSFQLDAYNLEVVDYYNFALREQRVTASAGENDGAAVRIQLQNDNINMTQWIVSSDKRTKQTMDLGPARVVLAPNAKDYTFTGQNEILLTPAGEDTVAYQIYTKSKAKITAKGQLKIADVVETGWMGIQLRLLKYLPKARQEIVYNKKSGPVGMATTPAIKIRFKDSEHWIGMNSNLKLFTDTFAYIVVYRNQMIDLGFDIRLDDFRVGRYQGTRRAMSYESRVTVPGLSNHLISMNEPLKYEGFTFYQASFQENEQGEATTSILSVNKDPGRPWKYLGSLMIVLGTIMMFYFKHYRLKIKSFMASAEEK